MEKLVDVPIDLTKTLPKTNRRSSFFDLPPVQESEKDASKANQVNVKLRKEWKDWQDALQALVKMQRPAKPGKLVLDSSYLNDEQKEYLSKAIDVEKYVDDLQKFSHEVLVYSKKKEWLQMKIDCLNRRFDETIKEKVLRNAQL